MKEDNEYPEPWQNRIISSGIKPASEFLAHELNSGLEN